MSLKFNKRNVSDKPQAAPTDKKTATNNVIRLLCLIAVTMVIFCLYKFLINHYYFEIVLGIYMGVATVAIFTYVIYNRGFSRRGVTPDMLPDTWSTEKKAEFIEDGERRLRRSRPLLVLCFAFAFTFLFDIIELFCFPLLKEIFGA